MKYLNEHFNDAISKNNKYQDMLETMDNEVTSFMNNFTDDPNVNSEWGHYYFCDDDGGRLVFDINKPHTHKCEVCNQEFKSEIFDGVWVYFYRNTAVLTAWKAACLYKAKKDVKYLNVVKEILGFYGENYTKFKIHNKERNVFDNYEEMKWGCGRILPQGLNESIICIRMIQTLEILKTDLDKSFLDMLYHNMFKEMYLLLKPQVNEIHNIRCWNNSAIGLIGFFFHDQEMIDFAFQGEFNIRKQITQGVTDDYFWYEGSIHYNFFTLEGIISLLLFSEIYNYDFGSKEKEVIRKMFISAYHYAFNNHFFPNPNDGWPSINLKTYSYIYHTATKIFGEDSEIGNLLKIIENNSLPRTPLPLSKPYYYNNEIPFERILLNTNINLKNFKQVIQETKDFPKSNYAILRNEFMNIFCKYGMNGPSHSHPDLINIEVMHQDDLISRDLSNAGYRARLCNEWHRVSLAHNTIIKNGCDIVSTKPGRCLEYSATALKAEALEVYPGVDYVRSILLKDNGFVDQYEVTSREDATFDYIFHLEYDIEIYNDLVLENASLGYSSNGYQHVLDTKKIISSNVLNVRGKLNQKIIHMTFTLEDGMEAYLLKTMDNPVNKTRSSILLRKKGKKITYKLEMDISTNHIQNFFVNEEIAGAEVADGVFRKILSYNENLMICEVSFKKGSIGAMHSHPHEQCTYIISGAFEFDIDGEKRIMRAGDSMYKQPNIIHGAVCLEEGKLLDIFTPCRKDFLKK